jgi:hypothetical protein
MKNLLLALLATFATPALAQTPHDAVKDGFKSAQPLSSLPEGLHRGKCYWPEGHDPSGEGMMMSIRNRANKPFDFTTQLRAILYRTDYFGIHSERKIHWSIDEGSWINTEKLNASIGALQVDRNELTGGLQYSDYPPAGIKAGQTYYLIRLATNGVYYVKWDQDGYCYFDERLYP